MNGFFPILTSLVLLVGMIVVMVRMDLLLTLVSLAIVPLLFLSIARLCRAHHVALHRCAREGERASGRSRSERWAPSA